MMSVSDEEHGAFGILMRSEFNEDGMLVIKLRPTNPIADCYWENCRTDGFSPPERKFDELGEYLELEIRPANAPDGGEFTPYGPLRKPNIDE